MALTGWKWLHSVSWQKILLLNQNKTWCRITWTVLGSRELSNLHQTNITFEVSCRQVKEAILHPQSYHMFWHIVTQIRDILETWRDWHIDCISCGSNRCAHAIATSVTRDHRYQSYIAREAQVGFISSSLRTPLLSARSRKVRMVF